jgi:DNA-binding winged helix-turn-helix (wHTH) protein
MDEQARHFYEFGDYRIDVAQRQLQRNGQPIQLTLKAFDVLLVLVENSGQILEKDRLLEAVWPDSFVEEGNLARNISTLRQTLGETREEPCYIETIPRRGYRFVASVKGMLDGSVEALALDASPNQSYQELTIPKEKIEPIGGAVPLDSKFYIVRPADHKFRAAIAQQDSIVLVKGSRQMGKTSLLARGLQQAREAGARVILTDFHKLNAAHLESAEKLFLALAESIADQLDLDFLPEQIWSERRGPNMNFERYLRREVLGKILSPIVWGLDEVDRLFTCDYGSEVFGLFRSWHNERSLDPVGPWLRLTLAIAYATEAHLFIKDENQSPFNVGTQLHLDDFTIEQVKELNLRYGSPLRDSTELDRFFSLVGGHPFLVRKGLYEISYGMELSAFEAQADRDNGLFGNHLRHLLKALVKDTALCDAVRGIIKSQSSPTAENFYHLCSAGLIAGELDQGARLRCQIYTTYLKRHLL